MREKLKIIFREARAELKQREKAAEAQPEVKTEEPVQAEAPPPVTEAPPEVKVVEPVAPPAPPVIDKVDVQELDANKGNPEAEQKARAFLDDPTPADSFSDDDLRTRLDAMRDVMADNELSVKTERALRDKLRGDRDVLRGRLAKVKAAEELKSAEADAKKAADVAAAAPAQGEAQVEVKPRRDRRPKFNINILITLDTPRRVVLRDRRPSDELEESELRQRIRVYRDFQNDPSYDSYDQDQRDIWLETVRRDRERLRRNLQEDRIARRDDLNRRSTSSAFTIDDEQDYGANDGPTDIFAAEVDDAEIEKVLIAPPRKKVKRRYTIQDIEAKPQLRDTMSRIEIDTIRFGFNEAFVREEEVDSLDQIASVIERVLKKYPREVFLIEGHTDAVGSDAYNAKLSKARAEAVKKTLTSFYIIPPKNLQTVGLGERYLKIPTAEAEAENRRVSISRATALIGELDQ